MKIGTNIHQRKRGVFRTLRGGSCANESWSLWTYLRVRDVPECRVRDLGFRIVVVRRSP